MVVSWIRRLPERSVSPNASGNGCEFRVSPSHEQARRLLSVLKGITWRYLQSGSFDSRA